MATEEITIRVDPELAAIIPAGRRTRAAQLDLLASLGLHHTLHDPHVAQDHGRNRRQAGGTG